MSGKGSDEPPALLPPEADESSGPGPPPSYQEALHLSEQGRRNSEPVKVFEDDSENPDVSEFPESSNVSVSHNESDTSYDEDDDGKIAEQQQLLGLLLEHGPPNASTAGRAGDDEQNEAKTQVRNRFRDGNNSLRQSQRRSSFGEEEAIEMEMMNLESESEFSAVGQDDGENADSPRQPDNHRVSLEGIELDIISPSRIAAESIDSHTSELGESYHPDLRRRHSRTYRCTMFPILTPVYSYIRRALDRASPKKKMLIAVAVVIFLGLLLFVSLFPASFVYVNYDEMGFSRNKVTGKHDYSEVYQTGCYLLAPQDEIVAFNSTAHLVKLNLEVMNSAGMNIGLNAMFQYFLKPEELHQLFKKYHFEYPSVVSRVAVSTVKNTAISFNMDQYRLNRTYVESLLFKQLRKALSGDCCDSCAGSGFQCDASKCKTANCSSGYHVDVRYFQLGKIDIPQRLMDQYTRQVLLKIEAEKEKFVQNAAVQRKTTEYNVKVVRNSANEIRQAAEAEKHVIKARAEAEKNRDIQLAYQKALKHMFKHLNVTTEEKQLSLIYMKALKDVSQNLFAFSYNYDKLSVMTP